MVKLTDLTSKFHHVRLVPAREKGHIHEGYDLLVPLDESGHLDSAEKTKVCAVSAAFAPRARTWLAGYEENPAVNGILTMWKANPMMKLPFT